MACVETNSNTGSAPTAPFVFRSCPNCSLSRSHERWVFWSLAVTTFAGASVFAALGYWLVLPFAGLEIGLLAWAFEALRRRAGSYETLTIDGDLLLLEWRSGAGTEQRREMNRQWARVECDCGAPGKNCHVRLCSHGRATEVGQFLSDEARLHLAATLRRQLQHRA